MESRYVVERGEGIERELDGDRRRRASGIQLVNRLCELVPNRIPLLFIAGQSADKNVVGETLGMEHMPLARLQRSNLDLIRTPSPSRIDRIVIRVVNVVIVGMRSVQRRRAAARTLKRRVERARALIRRNRTRRGRSNVLADKRTHEQRTPPTKRKRAPLGRTRFFFPSVHVDAVPILLGQWPRGVGTRHRGG